MNNYPFGAGRTLGLQDGSNHLISSCGTRSIESGKNMFYQTLPVHNVLFGRWRKLAVTFALLTVSGLGFPYGAWLQSFTTVMYLEAELDYETFDSVLPNLEESWNTALGFVGLITLGLTIALVIALVKLHRLGACVICGHWQHS